LIAFPANSIVIAAAASQGIESLRPSGYQVDDRRARGRDARRILGEFQPGEAGYSPVVQSQFNRFQALPDA